MPTKKKVEPKLNFGQKVVLKAKAFYSSKVVAGSVVAVLFAYIMFLSWQISSSAKKIDQLIQPQDEQLPLNTAAPYRPTATVVSIDPLKTPLTLNYEQFIYTEFEIKFRGGYPSSACPYRWVSIRDIPSIAGNVVGCLPPYSRYNVEEPYTFEGSNVWGLLAMQSSKWIALRYNGVEFTNWHEK